MLKECRLSRENEEEEMWEKKVEGRGKLVLLQTLGENMESSRKLICGTNGQSLPHGWQK